MRGGESHSAPCILISGVWHLEFQLESRKITGVGEVVSKLEVEL
jgi:hypothetical protein